MAAQLLKWASYFGIEQINIVPVFIGIIITLLLRWRKNIRIILKTLPRDLKVFWIVGTFVMYASKIALTNATLLTLFAKLVARNPKKVILRFHDKQWTAEELERYSNKIAAVFQQRGYKKGDVVAVLSYNSIEYIGIWLGLAKIGVISALINTNLRSLPLSHCINIAKCKGLIYTSDFAGAVDEIRENLSPTLEYLEYGENTELTNSMESAKDTSVVIDDPVTADDKLLYIYTSGTTGLPKAAIVAHNKVRYFAHLFKSVVLLRDDDVIYDPLPLYHAAGGLLGTLPALTFGTTVVIRQKFSASSYFPDCVKYGCTVGQYIGELCRYVLSTPPSPADRRHKVRVMIGNGLRADIWERFVQRFNVEQILEIYGATEGNANVVNLDSTVGAVGCLPSIIPLSWLPMGLIKYNTETSQPVRDENGLCIRCKPGEPGMWIGIISTVDPSRKFYGYVDEKETKKKIIRDVFKKGDAAFVSGDVLIMDEYRYLYFKDRTGDTYRWKGENVSTGEVEAVVSNLIGYRDCTVYGVQVGEFEGRAGMIALVDPNEEVNLEDLRAAIDKNLPSYARPLFLRILPKLELTGTFKVKKSDLQKEGFDPDTIKDRLYFKDPVKGYVPLHRQLYQEIVSGKVKI